MPRGAKKVAHQHNNRHENGIVAPGKRITRQRSDGHINATAEGSSQPNTPHLSLANPRSQLPDRRSTESQATVADTEDVEGRASGDVSEDLGLHTNGVSNGPSYRKIDVNAARGPAIHDSSVLSLALTILWSCPIGDTIAILIFLLSLPPTILTLTNALFAILTFMPPTASLSSFPTTFNDVFQASSGAPSFATIIFTDVIGLVMWLVIWTPLQVLALELAQAVVATTLGGGNSAKHKGSDHTIVCMGIVVISHVARHRWIRNRFFGYDWTVRLASFSNLPLGPAEFFSDDMHTSRTFASWFRVLVTLHILIQGVVHVVRRWYARRGHSPPASISKKTDPEAVAGSSVRSDGIPPASLVAGTAGVMPEPTTKSSLPNARDSKEKSNKKKRKQGTFVRSQQPLWAAFAATKVTVYRELDQSKMLQEATGSNAIDLKNLGDAPFALEEGRIWITQIHLSNFSFEASYFSTKKPDPGNIEAVRPIIGTGVDRSNPFFVRINGADWSSTTIRNLVKPGYEDVSAEQRWEGEVFGLSPSSSYICSFVRCEDGVEIFSTSVSTPSSSPPDQETLTTVTPPLQPHRPSSPTSPTTTLRNSIAVCETNLNESQARQKRSKKDNKAASASLRKEIDIFNSRLAKIAVEEKAHHNRHMQWNQQSRQADEAVAAMSIELESMGSIPEDLQHQWESQKSEWEKEKQLSSDARRELSSAKDFAQQEKAALQTEATGLQQKRERLAARSTKLQEQHQRLQSANAQGLNEKERREAELAAKAQDRRQIEEEWRRQMTELEQKADNTRQEILSFRQQIQFFASAYNERHMQIMNAPIDRSSLSEAEPSSHPSMVPGFTFPAPGQLEQASIRSNSASLRTEFRPRSTSLLSGEHGAANDFDDQDPAPPMPSSKPVGKMRGRKQSASAGGSVGSRLSPANKSGSPVWN